MLINIPYYNTVQVDWVLVLQAIRLQKLYINYQLDALIIIYS